MAARFWVTTGSTGGTGNWSNSQNWSATSGGAAGASVPGSADTATFNASSGAGIATVDSNVTIQTLTMTGFTGTLAFGTNTISLNSTGTVFTGANTCTVTGTPVINVTSTGSTGITVTTTTVTEANSISFNFTGGTYSLVFTPIAKNVNFTGFSGNWTARGAGATLYGSLTLSATMTLTAASATFIFGSTSPTPVTITSNGKTLDQPVQFNGVGGTFRLVDAFSLPAARTTTLTNGTLDLNSQTYTTGLFSSTNANARTIAFGTGSITCIGAGGTLWSTATATNFSVTGTPQVKISNSGALATTVSTGAVSEANSVSFWFTTGTYALTFLQTSNYAARNVDFTGFAGTWNATSGGVNYVYGDFTFSSSFTWTAGNNITFASTSATVRNITSNGASFQCSPTFNGVGGSWKFQDNFTTANAVTFTNGSIDANFKTITGANIAISTGNVSLGNFVSTSSFVSHSSGNVTFTADNSFVQYSFVAGSINLNGFTFSLPSTGFSWGGASAKTLTFNGGTLSSPYGANFNALTTVAGTGTGYIRITSIGSARLFTGNGGTYNCILSSDGANGIIITDANTFLGIANGVSPTSFVFPSGATTTVTNWNVSGTAGNLVTITSSTAGTAATLSKASGTVSSDYLSLKDSAATGGASWYAGANSTNVSGNSGWIFTAPPATNYSITALNGTYTLNGQSIGIARNRNLSGSYGSYSVNGQSVIVTRSRSLLGSYGSYSITGQTASIARGRNLSGSYGSYSLTGQSAVITYTVISVNYTITANAGSYALTGQSAAITRNRSLTSSYGSYVVTGQTADISRSRALNSDYGVYALTGSSANLVFGRVLSASPGNYAVTGQDATLTKSNLLSAENGLYSLAGQAVNITYSGAPVETVTQYWIEIRSFTESRRI